MPITNWSKPQRRRLVIVRRRIGTPPTGSRVFGVSSECGRSRVAQPAARITAFIAIGRPQPVQTIVVRARLDRAVGTAICSTFDRTGCRLARAVAPSPNPVTSSPSSSNDSTAAAAARSLAPSVYDAVGPSLRSRRDRARRRRCLGRIGVLRVAGFARERAQRVAAASARSRARRRRPIARAARDVAGARAAGSACSLVVAHRPARAQPLVAPLVARGHPRRDRGAGRSATDPDDAYAGAFVAAGDAATRVIAALARGEPTTRDRRELADRAPRSRTARSRGTDRDAARIAAARTSCCIGCSSSRRTTRSRATCTGRCRRR